ncbi:MAG: helix-turn-helix domain-containing protein [Planktothrix sp.]
MDLIEKKSRVRLLIEHLGIKQAEFCKQTGFTSGAVSQLYNGREPVSSKTAWKIKEAYPDVSMRWLLGQDDEMLGSQEILGEKVGENEGIDKEIVKLELENNRERLGLIRDIAARLAVAEKEDERGILIEILKNLKKDNL